MVDRSFPILMTTRPVTQTAEVEVKRAFTKRRGSLVDEKEKQRRKVPVRITPAKLRTKILGGERCFDKKFLILIRMLIMLNVSRLLSELKLLSINCYVIIRFYLNHKKARRRSPSSNFFP
jgi:hypothetical protein